MFNHTQVIVTPAPQSPMRLRCRVQTAWRMQMNPNAPHRQPARRLLPLQPARPAPSNTRRAAPGRATGRPPLSFIAHTTTNAQLAAPITAGHPARRARAAVRIHGGGFAARRHESPPHVPNNRAEVFLVVDINSI